MATLPASPALGTLVEAMQFDGTKNPDRRAAVEEDRALRLPAMGRRPDEFPRLRFERFTKTIPTYATKMPMPFRVNTLEGLHEGQVGDYLAIGPLGEMYPIAAEVMEESYVLDDDSGPDPLLADETPVLHAGEVKEATDGS